MKKKESHSMIYMLSLIFLIIVLIIVSVKLLFQFDNILTLMDKNNEVLVEKIGDSYKIELSKGYLDINIQEYPSYFGLNKIDGKKMALVCISTDIFTSKIPYLLIIILLTVIVYKSMKYYSPFITEIMLYTKMIGIILLYIGIFQRLIDQTFLSKLIFSKLYFKNPIQWEYIITGFLLILLSDILKKGCKLQKEADETL